MSDPNSQNPESQPSNEPKKRATTPALEAREQAKQAAKDARAASSAAKAARAAEVKAIKDNAATSKKLAEAASVSLGTAKRAIKEGVGEMRSGLTRTRLVKAAAELGLAIKGA